MVTLAGQRAQSTWALRQYNLAEAVERKTFYARGMARYIAAAPANGFTVEQVTQGQLYPAAEVAQYLDEASTDAEPDISEGQALREARVRLKGPDRRRRSCPSWSNKLGTGVGVIAPSRSSRSSAA